jgi:hypothetical protein
MLGAKRHLLAWPLLTVTLSCSASGTAAPSNTQSCVVATTSVLVNAGDTLRMNFTVPASSTADILSYEVDYLPNPLVSGPTLSCQLFNGDRLLGSGPCNGHFQSSAAALRLSGAPLIDFSTIAAGPSTDRIDFNVTGGSFAFDGRGTVSLGHLITTSTGPSIVFEASGYVSARARLHFVPVIARGLASCDADNAPLTLTVSSSSGWVYEIGSRRHSCRRQS